MGRRAGCIDLSQEERAEFERLVRRHSTSHQHARRGGLYSFAVPILG